MHFSQQLNILFAIFTKINYLASMLYSNYILKQDLEKRIDSTNLDEMTGSDDTVITEQEKRAVEKVASIVRHWYDADTEFRSIATHVQASTYEADDRVVDSGTLYVAKIDVPADKLISNTTYWEAKDDRNPVLVGICVDIMLYYISARNRSGSVPEYLFDNMKFAESDLVKIQKGHIELDIPERTFDTEEEENEDPGQAFVWGKTNVSENNEY